MTLFSRVYGGARAHRNHTTIIIQGQSTASHEPLLNGHAVNYNDNIYLNQFAPRGSTHDERIKPQVTCEVRTPILHAHTILM